MSSYAEQLKAVDVNRALSHLSLIEDWALEQKGLARDRKDRKGEAAWYKVFDRLESTMKSIKHAHKVTREQLRR